VAGSIAVFAPAKINLTLQVCGKRADGYHLLDSLVVFAGVGDTISATSAPSLSLTICGPFAAGLSASDDNLVLRAARLLSAGSTDGAAITLDKHLPVASGIGGGSSDAAATLIGCAQLWQRDVTHLSPRNVAAALGADVPVCMARAPQRMRGIGDELTSVPALPAAWLVLVNPNKPLATKAVFSALGGRHSGPCPAFPEGFVSAQDLTDYLGACSNDLEAPALTALPEIAAMLSALRAQSGCLLGRMSGSGPTCFGLFADQRAAGAAMAELRRSYPGWWVQSGPLLAAGDSRLSPTATV